MPGCLAAQTRNLLREGDLKLREGSSSSKLDVHCFLFTDMLLICKNINKKGDRVKVIRQPYILDRSRAYISNAPAYLSSFLTYLHITEVM
jgi:pleckstrin domain-containing family G protein 5